jgi:hypothetical protein
MLKPNTANLTPKQLNLVLMGFPGKQMSRVIKGIFENPSILTHDVCGSFYCNNVPDIAQKSASILFRHGLKLLCVPPSNNNAITKSHHWYLCHIGEVEHFDTSINSANDEVF